MPGRGTGLAVRALLGGAMVSLSLVSVVRAEPLPVDVKVNVKEFEGTGAGLALVEQSQPGDWDVMVIDSIARSSSTGPRRPTKLASTGSHSEVVHSCRGAGSNVHVCSGGPTRPICSDNG